MRSRADTISTMEPSPQPRPTAGTPPTVGPGSLGPGKPRSRSVGLKAAQLLGVLLTAMLMPSCSSAGRAFLSSRLKRPFATANRYLSSESAKGGISKRIQQGTRSLGNLLASERGRANRLGDEARRLLQPAVGSPRGIERSMDLLAASERQRPGLLGDRLTLTDPRYFRIFQMRQQVRRFREEIDSLPHILGLDIVPLAGPGSPRWRTDPDGTERAQPLDERLLRRILP